MILQDVITKHKLRRLKVSYKHLYDTLPRNRQPEFRHAVMASQGWQTATTFYNAMTGRDFIKPETQKDIEAIFRQFGVNINS